MAITHKNIVKLFKVGWGIMGIATEYEIHHLKVEEIIRDAMLKADIYKPKQIRKR